MIVPERCHCPREHGLGVGDEKRDEMRGEMNDGVVGSRWARRRAYRVIKLGG